MGADRRRGGKKWGRDKRGKRKGAFNSVQGLVTRGCLHELTHEFCLHELRLLMSKLDFNIRDLFVNVKKITIFYISIG